MHNNIYEFRKSKIIYNFGEHGGSTSLYSLLRGKEASLAFLTHTKKQVKRCICPLYCYKYVVKNESRAALEVSRESRWLRKGGSIGGNALPIVFFTASDFFTKWWGPNQLEIASSMDTI
jgi:hypothetical protein